MNDFVKVEHGIAAKTEQYDSRKPDLWLQPIDFAGVQQRFGRDATGFAVQAKQTPPRRLSRSHRVTFCLFIRGPLELGGITAEAQRETTIHF